MTIKETRQIYCAQLKEYQAQKLQLAKQKQALEKKMAVSGDGQTAFSEEAAVLELTMDAVNQKQTEYQDYMSAVTAQWTAHVNALSAQQQGDAMEKYVEDLAKIMEVARRIMKGGIVPASDEKKLMEFSMELYQSAKSIGAMMRLKEKEEYDSLWKEEEEKEYEDPIETADNAEVFAEGPEIVDVADTIASVTSEEGL